MRGACGPHKRIDTNDNPYLEKWYNCKYNDEPKPLMSKQSVEDFKNLCPALYTHDSQPLCCGDDQLAILKYDLMTAYALIGSCTSCYFNFRQLWCHFTCYSRQSEFVIPISVKKIDAANFTKLFETYSHHKATIESAQYDYEDYEYDDYEYKDEIKATHDSNMKPHNNNTIRIFKTTTNKPIENNDYKDEYDHEDYENDALKRLKRAASLDKKVEIVDKVITFVDKTFMEEFVNSCR